MWWQKAPGARHYQYILGEQLSFLRDHSSAEPSCLLCSLYPFWGPSWTSLVQSRQLKVSPDIQDFMLAGDTALRNSKSFKSFPFLCCLCFLSEDSCEMDRCFCHASDIFLHRMKRPMCGRWRSQNSHTKSKSELTEARQVGIFPSPITAWWNWAQYLFLHALQEKKPHENVSKTRKRSKERRLDPVEKAHISEVWIWHLKVWGIKFLMNIIQALQPLGHRDLNKVSPQELRNKLEETKDNQQLLQV